MQAEFVIHSAPVGKSRPRVTSHGTYTPKKTKDFEELVKQEYRAQCGRTYFYSEPVSVYVEAVFPVPKRVNRKEREGMMAGNIHPTKKPDVDNIVKIVCDALNGVAWFDDSQVVVLWVSKVYGETGNVRVVIREVGQ